MSDVPPTTPPGDGTGRSTSHSSRPSRPAEFRWRPRVLVIQHETMTPAGLLTSWLAEQQASVDTLRIDEDARLVDPRRYDLVVSLGSELAAYDDSIPWVSREVFFLEDTIEADVPVLGLCFGAQMLARVLGAEAHRAEKPEIGWVRI